MLKTHLIPLFHRFFSIKLKVIVFMKFGVFTGQFEERFEIK